MEAGSRTNLRLVTSLDAQSPAEHTPRLGSPALPDDDPPPAFISEWDDAKADFLARVEATRGPKTHSFYKDRLNQFMKWIEGKRIRLHDFRGRHLSAYLNDRRNQIIEHRRDPVTVGDTTRRHDAIAVRRLFRHAKREGLVDRDPVEDYELPAGNKDGAHYPSENDVVLLVMSLRDHWDPKYNRAICNVPPFRRRFFLARNMAIIIGLMDSGCRVGELLGLKLADVERTQKGGLLTFRKTKNRSQRTVPVSKDWFIHVDAWMRVRPIEAKSDLLFFSERDGPITVNSWGKCFRDHIIWARSQKAYAEMKYFTTHGLRHYAATDLSKQKQGMRAAQAMLGHKSILTTQRYTHPDEELMQSAHDAASTVANVLAKVAEKSEKPIMVNKRSERQKRKRLV
jgi:integrase/recombinase XerD